MKLILILSILLIGCSSRIKNDNLSTVSLGDAEEQIEIDQNKKNIYGPQVEGEDKTEKVRYPVIALNIYSSIYETIGSVELLKQFEEKKINISMISSNGFGAVIAVLYAKMKSASFVEWKLFALLKELDNKVPYSREWQKIINRFVKNEFKNLKLNQLKTLVLIPEVKNNKITLNSTDKISDAIAKTLNLNSRENFISKPENYDEILKNQAADLVSSVYFISTNTKMHQLAGYELGIYSAYLGQIINKSEIKPIQTGDKVFIDEIGVLSERMERYKKQVKDFTQDQINLIEKWQEENTSNFND